MASLSSLLLGSSFLLAASVFLHRHNGATTMTHLHFYMHDAYTGAHPTAMRVVSGRSLLASSQAFIITDDEGNATAAAAALSPRHFGDIVVLNNALTEGPSASSTRMGTAQGFAVRVSEGGVVSDLSMHIVVDVGEHCGSSVLVKGRIDTDVGVRESVVVGGTGRFRFTRGYMVSRSYSYSLTAGGIVEIELYLQN